MNEPGLVRVDTHRVMFVLYGLCNPTPEGLIFEAHPDAAGAVVARFAGRNGGSGVVVIPDEPRLRATLEWLAGDARGEVILRAVLAAVRACDGVAGGWAYERVLELLYGPRRVCNGHRESRSKKLPRVRHVVELLAAATWNLHAPVAQPAKPRRRDGQRDAKRVNYGGTFEGSLFGIEREGEGGRRTVVVDPELRRLLDAGPWDQRPVEDFRAARPGHSNPRGTKPSRAVCWLAVHGIWDYARLRQAEALRRDGKVQAVRVEDLLARWTSVDVDAIIRRRLMAALVDQLENELSGADAGGVGLAAPIVRERQAGRCELRLRIRMDAGKRSPAPRSPTQHHRRGVDRRPPVSATQTGAPASTGPPT